MENKIVEDEDSSRAYGRKRNRETKSVGFRRSRFKEDNRERRL